MNKNIRFILSACCLCFLASCGPSTFLIGKDGNTGYFGRDRPFLRTLLCTRGELKSILADANLSNDQKMDFDRFTCGEERSYESVLSLYLFLTPDEKNGLKNAFQKHGYDVNFVHC